MSYRIHIVNLLLIVGLLVPSVAVLAHSPSPEAKAKYIAEGVWEQKLANLRAFDAAQDPDMYQESADTHLGRHQSRPALSPDAVDTVRVAVILVDFPDFHYDAASYPIPGGGTLNCNIAGTPVMFDSLLFSQQSQDPVFNPTGSMTEWYLENSYGTYFIQGDVFGWYRAPQDYSDYVGSTDGLGGGAQLAADAVLAADAAGVDFTPYGNGTSSVQGVIIIHAGPGSEEGAYGIWSHRSNMNVGGTIDGLYFSGYSMQPEEKYNQASLAHMGVYCHEWGHVLGAPDWYDTNDNPGSEGLGRWCVMASGSWNNDGRTPSHFNCFVKYFDLGFIEMIDLRENLPHAPIPQVASEPLAYLLRQYPVDNGGGEFWFVENRQRVGFDQYLPGSGLLIYHFDGYAPTGNTDPSHYTLAVEEADGRRDLAFNGSRGQASDPFPGTANNRSFHSQTVPDSRTNAGVETEVNVLNISDSDSVMYADLNVFYAMPYLVLVGDSLTATDDAPGGNGDGAFEQGETVEFYLEVENVMQICYWPTLSLDVNNPDVEILQNDVSMGNRLSSVDFSATNEDPIIIRVPSDFISSVVHFTFAVTSDQNYSGGHDRSFTNLFEFDITLGRPQILLVDDDNNHGDEPPIRDAFIRLGLPFEHWDKAAQGSPVYADLSEYEFVFWMTGAYWPPSIPGGTLTAADVTFMKALLNNHGNLMLASPSAPVQLEALDPLFMTTFLHADLTGSHSRRWFHGDGGHSLSNGMAYTTRNGVTWDEITPTLTPTNGGVSAFSLMDQSGTVDYGSCGVAYDGSYRTAFLSFPIEFLDKDLYMSQGYAPPDSLIRNTMRFFSRGAATAVEDNTGDNLLPTDFALDQNYPNPFNPTTTISYSIEAGRSGQTNLAIFNVLGQKVATLVNGAQGPGRYSVEWSGREADGSRVASGIYFYRLTHGDRAETRKMMMLK